MPDLYPPEFDEDPTGHVQPGVYILLGGHLWEVHERSADGYSAELRRYTAERAENLTLDLADDDLDWTVEDIDPAEDLDPAGKYSNAYVGDEEDGVFLQAIERGGGWFFGTVVDCDTGGWCGGLTECQGPYDTEAAALADAHAEASEWCFVNDVITESDIEDNNANPERT